MTPGTLRDLHFPSVGPMALSPDVVLLLDDLPVGEVPAVGAGGPRPGARRHGDVKGLGD